MIRSPIDSKCQSSGLKGCPELVEGTIAYAEGNKPLATRKLARARALNTPDKLREFSAALRTIADTAPDVGKPLGDVAAFLSGEVTLRAEGDVAAAAIRGTPAPTAAPATINDDLRREVEELTLYSLTAPTDPMRIVSETVVTSEARGVDCVVAGSAATCLRRRQGPLVVTDVVASEECGQRVFLAAANADTPGVGFPWILPARTVGVHGGAFVLAGWQWLFVAIKPPAKPQLSDDACFITWSAFKPRLVPALGKKEVAFDAAK